MPNLRLADEPAADALLDDNPMALLIGMLLDQQRSMLIRGKSANPMLGVGFCGLCGASLAQQFTEERQGVAVGHG